MRALTFVSICGRPIVFKFSMVALISEK
jgi:hypothetical protein